MSDKNINPAAVAESDLGWSQARETVRMLSLAVAQIQVAMRESDDSVAQLTRAFTNMMSHEQQIAVAARKLPEKPGSQDARDTIQNSVEEVSREVQSAVVEFQFYDKLTQRLAHVGSTIEALGELVSDESRKLNPRAWQDLQASIKSGYSMREEHEMFDSVMNGGDVQEAIRSYHQAHQHKTEDDIEFF